MGDVAKSGLENAVSLQGGAHFLRNVRAERHAPTRIELIGNPVNSAGLLDVLGKNLKIHFNVKRTKYSCTIQVEGSDGMATMPEEQLVVDLNVSSDSQPGFRPASFGVEKGKLGYEAKFTETPELDVLRGLITNVIEATSGLESLAQQSVFGPPLLAFLHADISRLIGNIGFYDVNPKEPKIATLISGKTELESDASNLAIVLGKLLRNAESKRRLLNILGDVLPFVNDLAPELYSDGSMFFQIVESYSPNIKFPAHLISDGTVNIIAIIVALYFEEKPLIIIEEPERNVHPVLI